MDDVNEKREIVDRVCHRIKDRYLARSAETPGWWSPIVGRVMPGQVIAVHGAWPLQRHLLGRIVAAFGVNTDAVLRGPAALLDGVLEEAIAIQADVSKERIPRRRMRNEDWRRLAGASGRMDGVRFELENVENLPGVELCACARWFFGMSVAHPDVDIEVIDPDGVIHLVITDGRTMPPTCRRRRLKLGITPIGACPALC